MMNKEEKKVAIGHSTHAGMDTMFSAYELLPVNLGLIARI